MAEGVEAVPEAEGPVVEELPEPLLELEDGLEGSAALEDVLVITCEWEVAEPP